MAIPTITQFAVVAAGGALGAISRFGIQSLSVSGDDKYCYTAIINISGSIIMGILWSLFSHFGSYKGWELLILTGFLGGYTTYSAFALEAISLINKGQFATMSCYVVITIVLGLGGCALGLIGTDRLLRHLGY